uniref:Uncharacterized protein n=1 Tax=Salix viminalis TaxID=40686 RepID=A0A6N2L3U4_SALVM
MACEDQCRQGLKPKYDCLLFDVDDTLYPRSSGLLEEVTENIQEYMVQKLGVEETEASQINGVLYKSYGTSMAGLKIFSNADKAHVAKVLSRLGLEDCFDGVICFETLNPCNYEGISSSDENGVRRPSYTSRRQILDIIEHPCQSDSVPVLQETPVVCKPFEDAFEQAFKLANINPRKTVFFDDSVRNIKTGKLMGLHTVLEALSDLWEAEDKTEARSFAGKVSMETTVTA